MFSVTSRYYNLPVLTYVQPDGTTISYVGRRIVPQSNQFSLLQDYTVGAGDRLDQVTAKFLNDPTRFWQIADANNALQPEELTDVPGSTIRITLPAGVPGIGSNA